MLFTKVWLIRDFHETLRCYKYNSLVVIMVDLTLVYKLVHFTAASIFHEPYLTIANVQSNYEVLVYRNVDNY